MAAPRCKYGNAADVGIRQHPRSADGLIVMLGQDVDTVRVTPIKLHGGRDALLLHEHLPAYCQAGVAVCGPVYALRCKHRRRRQAANTPSSISAPPSTSPPRRGVRALL